MFTNPYREKCVNILEKLLPRRAVQDSTLLQAYATFHMMKEVTLSGANYAEIYRAASRKSAPYLYALLADFAAFVQDFTQAGSRPFFTRILHPSHLTIFPSDLR